MMTNEDPDCLLKTPNLSMFEKASPHVAYLGCSEVTQFN